mgnify:CR=1
MNYLPNKNLKLKRFTFSELDTRTPVSKLARFKWCVQSNYANALINAYSVPNSYPGSFHSAHFIPVSEMSLGTWFTVLF